MRVINLIILLSCLFCCNNTTTKKDWSSSFRSLSFKYESPFTLLPIVDSEKKTLAGVIDYSDGKSCVIKMEKDLPKDQVSDKMLHDNAKTIMLGENPENKLLYETDTTFHSHSAHKMIFLMNTKKWGKMNQISYISRDGKDYFSIQILYPYGDGTYAIPESLVRFQKAIKINEP